MCAVPDASMQGRGNQLLLNKRQRKTRINQQCQNGSADYLYREGPGDVYMQKGSGNDWRGKN